MMTRRNSIPARLFINNSPLFIYRDSSIAKINIARLIFVAEFMPGRITL